MKARDPRGRSPLQQEQVERTRQKILEGLARVLSRGVAALSVPSVARESGVSVPTVYRYFKSKEELLRGLVDEYEARLGVGVLPPPPVDLDGLSSYLRALFRRYEEMEPSLRTLAAAHGVSQTRAHAAQRLRAIEDWLDTVAPDVSDEDHVRLRNLVAVLLAPATQRAFKDDLDVPPDEAAEAVSWAVRRLLRATQLGGTKESGY